MSLTILYRNPKRPDEDGMTMIVGQAEAASVMALLEKQGMVVVKVTFVPFARVAPTPAIPISTAEAVITVSRVTRAHSTVRSADPADYRKAAEPGRRPGTGRSSATEGPPQPVQPAKVTDFVRAASEAQRLRRSRAVGLPPKSVP